MQCDEFDQRFNGLLDLRRDPASDAPLTHHAEECSTCARVLEDWRRIDAALPSALPSTLPTGSLVGRSAAAEATAAGSITDGGGRQRWSRGAFAASLAATLLGGLWFSGGAVEPKPAVVLESVAPEAALDLKTIRSRVAQPEWWGSVARAAWEPVDPLAESFRPLTNSFQTAFELLTPLAGSSTPVPTPLPEDANVGLAVAPRGLV